MTKKNTKAKKMIQKLGELYGVYYTDKTYRNIKKILECYREYVYGQGIFDFSLMEAKSISGLLPRIYIDFISDNEIADQEVNLMVVQMINDELTRELLKQTLEDIKKFSELGEDYYFILNRLFFTEAYPSNTEIYLDLDYSSTQYSYRKEEATMLLGICFWHRCLKYWDGYKKDMDDIRVKKTLKKSVRDNIYIFKALG